jgi:hypothetical protein
MSRTLTLVPTDDWLPREGPAPRARELETLLSRARRVEVTTQGRDAVLLHLFGAGTAADADVPVAPVTYALDCGVPPDGYVLRCDPVHVVADRDVLRVVAHGELRIGEQEARDIGVALNAHFAVDGLRFELPQSHRWYVLTSRDARLRTVPLRSVLGAALDAYLPQGADARRWRGWLNEMQMLLHAHPVNAAREARGEPPINSVWFWGGGRVPQLAPKPWAQAWGDDPFALGLAKLSSTPRSGAPADAREWLDAAITPGEHLLALPAPRANDEVAQLNARWIAPLLAALRESRLDRLTLHALDGAAFTVDRRALRRWWVRRRHLSEFMQSR